LTKKTVRFAIAFTTALLLFYAILFSVKIDRDKPGLEAFMFKVKIAPAELFKTKIDRENHKDLWDHWRGYEVKRAYALMKDNPSSFVFGTGYGSLVNLKFYAPLTGEKNGIKYISELHNGYMYLFYKTGIIGILILLFFLLMLYRMLYLRDENRNFVPVFISAIGLLYLFTTLTITGIYNGRDVIIFILGALLYFQQKTAFQKDIVA
jgi:O-antigen ligase